MQTNSLGKKVTYQLAYEFAQYGIHYADEQCEPSKLGDERVLSNTRRDGDKRYH
jgi:hypothetical protein